MIQFTRKLSSIIVSFGIKLSASSAYPSKPFPLSAKKSGDNGFELIKLEDYIAGSQPRNDSQPEKPGSDRSSSQPWQPEVIKQFNQEINSIALSPDRKKIAIRYEQRKMIVQDFAEYQLLDKRSLPGGNATPIMTPLVNFLQLVSLRALIEIISNFGI